MTKATHWLDTRGSSTPALHSILTLPALMCWAWNSPRPTPEPEHGVIQMDPLGALHCTYRGAHLEGVGGLLMRLILQLIEQKHCCNSFHLSLRVVNHLEFSVSSEEHRKFWGNNFIYHHSSALLRWKRVKIGSKSGIKYERWLSNGVTVVCV